MDHFRADIRFTPTKFITHPSAIKISIESLFNIYDCNHDDKMTREEIKKALTDIF